MSYVSEWVLLSLCCTYWWGMREGGSQMLRHTLVTLTHDPPCFGHWRSQAQCESETKYWLSNSAWISHGDKVAYERALCFLDYFFKALHHPFLDDIYWRCSSQECIIVCLSLCIFLYSDCPLIWPQWTHEVLVVWELREWSWSQQECNTICYSLPQLILGYRVCNCNSFINMLDPESLSHNYAIYYDNCIAHWCTALMMIHLWHCSNPTFPFIISSHCNM